PDQLIGQSGAPFLYFIYRKPPNLFLKLRRGLRVIYPFTHNLTHPPKTLSIGSKNCGIANSDLRTIWCIGLEMVVFVLEDHGSIPIFFFAPIAAQRIIRKNPKAHVVLHTLQRNIIIKSTAPAP